jgi:hypothetical protein
MDHAFRVKEASRDNERRLIILNLRPKSVFRSVWPKEYSEADKRRSAKIPAKKGK